jgi:hypothetical protein
MNLRLHGMSNIGLSLLIFGLILYSYTFSYFSVVSKCSEFKVGLVSLSYRFVFENGERVSAFSTISDSIQACEDGGSAFFEDVCPDLRGFQAGGVVYILISFVVGFCLLNSALGLWWVMTKKGKAKLEQTNYIGAAMYIIAILSQYLLSIGNVFHNKIKEDTGIGYEILISVLMVLISLHYYFVVRIECLKDYESTKDEIFIKKESIFNSLSSSKAGDSEDELSLAKRLERKKVSRDQMVQTDIIVDNKIERSPLSFRFTETTHISSDIARESYQDKLSILSRPDPLANLSKNAENSENKGQRTQEIKSKVADEGFNFSSYQNTPNLSEIVPDLERKLSVSENVIKIYEESIKKLETQVKNLESINNEQVKALDQSVNHLKKLEEVTKDRDRLFEDLSEKRSELYKIKNQFSEVKDNLIQIQNDWDTEKANNSYTINLMTKETEQLRFKLRTQEESMNKELSEAYNEIERLTDKLKFFEIEYEAAKKEIERLNDIQALLSRAEKNEVSDDVIISSSALSDIISLKNQKAEINFDRLDKSFSKIANEKEELRRSLNEKDLKLKELAEENQRLQNQLFINEPRVLQSQESEPFSENTFNSPSESPDTSFMNVYELVIIENISEVDIRANALIEAVYKLKKESPMIYSNVWKLMESLMQEKAKVDNLDLTLDRSVRPMIDFTFEFLNLHFGLQTLALRQLKALLMSLEELYKVKHPYGVFFCRLLGVYHSRPIPTHLSVYLMQVQSLFNGIAVTKAATFAQNYEVLQYGGQASIVDIMELVMKVCKNNRIIGERIIYSLHKDSDKKLEMTIIKVLGTMAKMNKDPVYLFEMLDINHTSNIDYHEFVDGIRLTLGIWITQNEAEDLCAYIDSDFNGVLTLQEWKKKANFDEILIKIYEKIALVTKTQLLNAFIEEYELEIIEDYNKLRSTIKVRSLNIESFTENLKKIDPNIEDHEVKKLFKTLQREEKAKNVSPEGFCTLVLRNKIGGNGIGMFGNFYIDLSQLKLAQ